MILQASLGPKPARRLQDRAVKSAPFSTFRQSATVSASLNTIGSTPWPSEMLAKLHQAGEPISACREIAAMSFDTQNGCETTEISFFRAFGASKELISKPKR